MKTSWVTKRLGDLGEIVRGKGIRRSETVPKGNPCLRYGEIYTNFNYVLDEPCSFVPEQIYRECPHIKYGDVVFSLTGENKEEIAKALAYLGEDEVAAGGDLAIWTNHRCDAKFLAYIMYAPAMIAAKAHASNGDIIVHASVKKMQQIEIPVPPLAEQKRIVAKIDAAFEKIDKLKANAERNLANAKELFQSALNDAMRPKPGWVVKRLGEVCESVLGKMLDRQKNKGNPEKYLRNVNVRWGTFDLSDLYEMGFENDEQERYGLRSGDLVMCEGGEPGRCAVWTGTPATMKFQKALHRIRCGNTIDPYYLYYYFRNISCSGVLQSYFAGRDATIKHLTGQLLKRVKIVFPSIEEQLQIVERLDRESKLCSRLQSNYTRLMADCAEMRQVVLKEAFEGRL